MHAITTKAPGTVVCPAANLTNRSSATTPQPTAARAPKPRTFQALLKQFGNAQEALAALPSLARRGGANGSARICARADAEREIKAARPRA